MFTKNLVVAIVCVLALTAWSGTAFADLVANGGFETGDWTGWTAVNAGTPFPYGDGNSVAVVNLGAGAYEGSYAADLTKATYGQLSATNPGMYAYCFAVQDGGAVTTGKTYVFSFAAKKLQGDANSRLEVASNLVGANLQWSNTSTPGTGLLTVGANWTAFNYTCVATGTDNYIAFRPANTAYYQSQNPAATNPIADEYLIDAVSVRLVPEPSSCVLLAAGLIGLLCYAWRKRR